MLNINLFSILFFFFINILFSQVKINSLIQIKYPSEIKLDKYYFSKIELNNFNDIYLLDRFSSKIILFKINENEVVYSNGLSLSNQLNATFFDISVNLGLEIFATDLDNHKVYMFDKKLNFLNSLNFDNSDNNIEFPKDIETNSYGHLWVSSDSKNSLYKINFNGDILNEIYGNSFHSFFGIKEFDLNKYNEIGLIDNKNTLIQLNDNGRFMWEKTFDFNITTINEYRKGWILISEDNEILYIDNRTLKFSKIINNNKLDIVDIYIKKNKIYFLTKNNLIFTGFIDYEPY